MCYSTGMSYAFALLGIAATVYVVYSKRFKYKYLPMLLLFYTVMEILQGTQYFFVNECNNRWNILSTEFAYILVIVQPLMWNFFFYENSDRCEKNIFVTSVALNFFWIAASVASRVWYKKENRDIMTAFSRFGLEDGVCARKQKTHVYWTWTSANFYDFKPTMLMYALIWFVPPMLTRKFRWVSVILRLGLVASVIAAFALGEAHTMTSLWCFYSVPTVLLVMAALK